MRISDSILQAWREASRHDAIELTLPAIASLLAADAPVAQLGVYRVDPEHHLLARIAVAPQGAEATLPTPAAPSEAELRSLTGWIRKGVPALIPEGKAVPRPLLPLRTPRDATVWAAPLEASPEATGVVVAVSVPGRSLAPSCLRLLEGVSEPIAVALANDGRLHELAALREAAEADRRSLLRRLGRTDITDVVVGERGGLVHVMKRVDLVSASDAPVLLLGETGTGKEVIARAIHQRSDRREGPFIRVNCGAIPPELVDSQLFGHEKGAFTGAGETRKGWFERADRGTLFLDEIGELPLDAQVRFLRVLQDSLVERVGGGEPIPVDVRVVAATHRDLAAMASSGAFREDLWYRIAVFPILLPPLRDRLDDIPALAEHFAHRAAVRFGLPPVEPSQADLAALRAYDWPGNIRELGAVIDRAAILGEGRSLQIAAALGGVTPRRDAPGVPRRLDAAPGPEDGVVTLDEAARRHIVATLERTRGRVEGEGGAAALLGINPHTLRARMRKLGIRWADFRPR